MRSSTIFASLLTFAVVASATPAAPLPRADSAAPAQFTSLESFRAAPRDAQKSYLRSIDPKTWTLSPEILAKIAQQPKVAKRLNGAALTMQNMRDWLVRFDGKHAEGKQA
ncbi:hypothetical protein C8R46DRAFT_1226958 [Mycena filopes]|nr:hypothetical protein C8R46DRAFT_1226958 [Mycena filopes]